MSEWLARVSQVLRYGIGLAILLWVIARGEWEATLETLAGVSPGIILVLLGLAAGGLAFRVLMWYALITPWQSIRYRTAVVIDLIVNFVNQLLPSRLAGRSVAPLVVHHQAGVSLPAGVGLTGVNTALYALVYGVVAAVGVLVTAATLSPGVLVVVTSSTALYFGVGVISLAAGLNATAVDVVADRIEPAFSRLPVVGERLSRMLDSVPEFTDEAAGVFRQTLTTGSAVRWYVLGWIGALAVFPALRVAVLLSVFGTPFQPLAALPLVLVTAYSVTLLPLTPGGIGVTEATAAVVLASLGVPYEAAASAILVDRVLGVYLPALGGWYPTVRTQRLTLSQE